MIRLPRVIFEDADEFNDDECRLLHLLLDAV